MLSRLKTYHKISSYIIVWCEPNNALTWIVNSKLTKYQARKCLKASMMTQGEEESIGNC